MKFWLQSCLASRGVVERGRARSSAVDVRAELGKVPGSRFWGCRGSGMRSDTRLSPRSGCAPLEINTGFSKPRHGGSSGSLKGLRVSAALNTSCSNDILRNYAIDSDEESPSIFEEKSTQKTPGRQKEKFLNFSSLSSSPCRRQTPLGRSGLSERHAASNSVRSIFVPQFAANRCFSASAAPAGNFIVPVQAPHLSGGGTRRWTQSIPQHRKTKMKYIVMKTLQKNAFLTWIALKMSPHRILLWKTMKTYLKNDTNMGLKLNLGQKMKERGLSLCPNLLLERRVSYFLNIQT
ncbi:uncharacterized protein [Patagioenas fasciata]|uniref:uncharacterized protein n=1 Tax=Patagioenas fasciata TaxID=372321 RepID=UPI0032E8B056